ncbi:MAG: oligosaccharide flippase family protein [Gemmatimonadota bacterium]|nr:oligosaccharide flippase family protein [Gemmatimonadota bacterium]
MSLAARSAQVMAIRVTTLAVQIPVSIMLARFLGVEGKGLYTLLTVVPWMVSYMLLCGMDTAQTYLLSSRRAALGQLVLQSVSGVVVISLAALPVYLLLIAPRVIESVPQVLLLVSACLVPLSLGRYFILSILLGFERTVSFNLLYLAGSLMVLVLMGVFAGLLDYGLKGALAAFVTAQALVLPVGLRWIAQGRKAAGGLSCPEHKGREKLRGLALLKTSLVYGLKGHLAGVLVTLNQRFDILLLGALSTSREVGLYSAAVALAETVWHVPMSVHLTLFPRTAALGREEASLKLPRACRMTLLLTLVMALGLACLGHPLIRFLFGRDFLPAYFSVLALLPGVVALGQATIFESFFAGVDKRHYQSISALCAFVLSLVLGITLIPAYGALGAALASTGSYCLQMVLSVTLYRCRGLGRFSFGEFFIPRPGDIKALLETFHNIFKRKKPEKK